MKYAVLLALLLPLATQAADFCTAQGDDMATAYALKQQGYARTTLVAHLSHQDPLYAVKFHLINGMYHPAISGVNSALAARDTMILQCRQRLAKQSFWAHLKPLPTDGTTILMEN